VVGAAVTAAGLLGLDRDLTESAVRLALLRAAGLQAAFGSDGKSLQVGLAAAAGASAARLAQSGAHAGPEVTAGFEQAYGARWPADLFDAAAGDAAVAENWIKAYPCCLQTHSAIEAAELVRARSGVPDGTVVAVVHPVSRLTAFRDDVADGLEAKFSIPYLVAYTLLHGPPRVRSFESLDPEARVLAERIAVHTDDSLLESEARLDLGNETLARVGAARGSPQRPMDSAAIEAKVRSLAGNRLDGVLDDADRPMRDVLEAADLA
jgi:2-methylcitrate dehydratase PrpD